jgi:hypothetical protein
MERRRGIALLAACAICLGAAAAAEEGESEMQRKTRELGLSIGNTHVCTEGEERERLKTDWQMIYDVILKDVGSDLAFVFATASGYGASLPRDALDCAALRESWRRTREDFGLVPEDG